LFNSLGASQVALTVVPVGRGKVSFNPPAGTVFSTGQLVTITAVASPGKSFVNWSGDATGTQNPLPVTLNQSKTIFANFSIDDQLSFEPLSVRGLGEGFELTLTGEFGMSYRIDGSTNLSNWVPLITLTNSFGTMQYIDFGATNFPRRFYRGVPLP
jgi:Divergent InlB B-repeat domain